MPTDAKTRIKNEPLRAKDAGRLCGKSPRTLRGYRAAGYLTDARPRDERCAPHPDMYWSDEIEVLRMIGRLAAGDYRRAKGRA